MTRTIEAIYSGGVLKPVQPLEGVAENGRVLLTVTTPDPAAAPFADWVGDMPDADAEEMRRIVHEEFERVDPNEWKK